MYNKVSFWMHLRDENDPWFISMSITITEIARRQISPLSDTFCVDFEGFSNSLKLFSALLLEFRGIQCIIAAFVLIESLKMA